ncbi:MAG TPA: MarR family transcriptional regulator [Polyangiaceae bacterium]|nr:MarR family transcriptional regulator [Polyangiaceae bacterium]
MSSARALPLPEAAPLSQADYRALAELRYQIRGFLGFSERAARAHGTEPQQHQLLLALKGLPDGRRPTIGTLAERLCVEHHTVVTLTDRLEKAQLVQRSRGASDRREVLLTITKRGEDLLAQLSTIHRDQLKTVGPSLQRALAAILERSEPQLGAPAAGSSAV